RASAPAGVQVRNERHQTSWSDSSQKKIFLKDCCKRNRVQCRQYFHGDVFVKTAMNQAVAG
ncbi:MAG: hypothetical protein ACK48U_01185, partial [Planctomyces sp.]